MNAARVVLQAALPTRFGEKQLANKKKKLTRRVWTKDDVRTLKTMARSKAGVRKIAKALKRTPGATSIKAVHLGVSLSTR